MRNHKPCLPLSVKDILNGARLLLLISFCGCATPKPVPPKPVEPPKILFYQSYKANETLTEFYHKGDALKKENPDKHITGEYIYEDGKAHFIKGW